MLNLDIVTIVIIIANVLISLKGFDDRYFFEQYKFNVGKIKRNEHIRMFSSGFLHADIQHLLFNMMTLYFFAGIVVLEFGNYKFILIYIASLIFGNLLSLYFHRDEDWYSAIGASGAVTGILYSAILLEPNLKINFIPGYIFGVGYLLYSIYGMKKRLGNIGHDAHFGGAVGGYLITLLLKPSLLTNNLFYVGLLAIPIIILFVMYKTGKLS